MQALHAINLGILTALYFVIGMIKPKWPLFFLEKPTRWHILFSTTVFFMIVMTMYGEGVKQDNLKKKHSQPASTSAPVSAPAPVPVPVPVPTPEPAKSGKPSGK
jgi:hypothetical protein